MGLSILRKAEEPSQRERPVAVRFASDSAEIDPDTDSDPDTDGVETMNKTDRQPLFGGDATWPAATPHLPAWARSASTPCRMADGVAQRNISRRSAEAPGNPLK